MGIPICSDAFHHRKGLGNISETYHLCSEGPEFNVINGNESGTLAPAESYNLTFTLITEVTDPDGVDTVIGSYNRDNKSVWQNISMYYSPTERHPNLYKSIPLNYTLGPGNWGVIWWFKFYANDSNGNWSSSGVWFNSIHGGASTSTSIKLQDLLVIISFILIVSTVILFLGLELSGKP